MAHKHFALPLDDESNQTGDINLDKLASNNASVEFRLTNVTSGSTNLLNLITCKAGVKTDHISSATVNSGIATVTLAAGQIAAIYTDASAGDWDYVEIHWTTGAVDTPNESNSYELQGGGTYDTHGWPPKTK
jgi:hypothetical protein